MDDVSHDKYDTFLDKHGYLSVILKISIKNSDHMCVYYFHIESFIAIGQ